MRDEGKCEATRTRRPGRMPRKAMLDESHDKDRDSKQNRHEGIGIA
jgi:hypothetical protein